MLGAIDAQRALEAIAASQAVIEFDLQGKVLSANANFCAVLGYQLSEIVGKHHSMFCEASHSGSPEYRDFWSRLGSGTFASGTYKRIAKGGTELWVQATYNPVKKGGKPYKIVKIASDVTAAKRQALEDAAKLEAISRSQFVIEFTSDGQIIAANENFCRTMGYALTEIVGKHHTLFCRKDYIATAEYGQFWKRLAAGEFFSDEFVRVSKSGKEVWIQAAYNPIINSSGEVIKVVKFATDVTARISAIEHVNSALSALSQGDLTTSLDLVFVPSMEELRANFNSSVLRLRQTMETIGMNGGEIAAAAYEISNAADSFSKRTETQAASLEETAAALEQITTTVADSSRRAHDAGLLVARTKQGAEASGEIVRSAVGAMGEIERSSNGITNIIGVIDDIAFQTNLLALNAGVEAARAGEAGKGFAVVAQEVRELAQRSAAAANEIKSLISTSGQHVRRGVDLVSKTGEALAEIVERVGEINDNVAAIVEAAREQSVGLKEINVAVNSMDQATQQNAAMAEESTAASSGLAEQAAALRQLLAQFKVDSALNAPSARGFVPTERQSTQNARRHARASVLVNRSAAVAYQESWQDF
ncbi:PAS domain-containing methyl-accepting chemotaxis protein [Rhizobium sp. BG4]|uniref:methyl-accepting chemotaxis protein n=1 Tax=Rhizobium sp. BG4 TaxID=2613770 RepID=UPI00193DE4A5|nr:PAS domain-containing methyl-accepting chemotaxis protein [Rhizobium sp. BG4]QRM47223.1 PAS domain S-box protein [Rhizobium sp. BG4]